MTRMIRGSVLLAACVGAWACTSDPTSDEAGKASSIEALPTVVIVKQDSSQLIGFRLVDELGGTLAENWTISNSSTLFSVALDSSYRPVYGGSGDSILTLPEKQTEVRATIAGLQLGSGSFTVSAGGKSLTIPVNVVPSKLAVTFSPANPAPGDTVTMTLPTGLKLTPTSVITFPGNLAPVAVVIAADSQSATFITAPTTDTTATVTKVYNTQFPTLPVFTYSTYTKVTGTMSGTWTGDLPSTITPASSSGSPNGTGSLTAVLAAGYAFKSSAPASEFSFPTQTAPINAVISADSSSVTMDIGPNVASPLQATRITFKGAPQFEYTLVSPDSVYTPVIANFPGTLSVSNPQIGQAITLTAGAGFNFQAALGTVAFPLVPNAIVTGRTATTITMYPYPGSAGNPSSVSGVISTLYPAFGLTIPGVLTTPLTMLNTVAAGMAGTDAYATAPVLSPGQGVVDAATFACAGCGVNGFDSQIYQYTFATAGSRTFTLTYSRDSDLGLYFETTPGGGPVVTTACDSHGNGAGAQPETCTANFPAGTYYLNVEDFSPGYGDPSPTWIAIRVQ